MQYQYTSLERTGAFSPLFLDYIHGQAGLDGFYEYNPSTNGITAAIRNIGFPGSNRKVLQAAIKEQYQGLDLKDPVKQNINKLTSPDTFTVTTGHQLNLFTGPLYFIYKLVTTINLAKRCKSLHPEKHFVPVYWMASEDHDFEEINHFSVFGKDYTWESKQQGAVGRFHLEDLKPLLHENEEWPEDFVKAYENSQTLAEATRRLVDFLFGKYGLLILDADSPALKSLFKEVVKKDITSHKSDELVQATSDKLFNQGYKPQVHAREINFFYLQDGLRKRIVFEGGQYKVLDTDISMSEQELTQKLDEHPECFSPNVVMRPVYQQMILPNLAYVGGPAELAYWLQLKGVFDHYEVDFPVLMPRNFALAIDKTSQKKIHKLDIATESMFDDWQELKKKFIELHIEEAFDIEREKAVIADVFRSISHKVTRVDGSLEGKVGSLHSQVEKLVEGLEKKLNKANEQKNEQGLQQLEKLKHKLFPGGQLQERKDNVLNHYINHPGFIDDLVNIFDPLDFQFYLLYDE